MLYTILISSEFKEFNYEIETVIKKFYTVLLNREPDKQGIIHWTNIYYSLNKNSNEIDSIVKLLNKMMMEDEVINYLNTIE